MNKHTIEIKGQKWTFKLLTHKAYTKKFKEEDSEAITLQYEKIVYFDRDFLCTSTIRHELLHTLVAETHVESSNLEAGQMEELCCSILEIHYYNIGNWTDELINAFLKKESK